MLRLNIQPVFQLRQINKPYTFLMNAGFSSSTATRLLNGHGSSLHLKHLSKLCELLYCTPDELLEYYPDAGTFIPSHPLTTLHAKPDVSIWKEQVKTMPLSQLREITSNAALPVTIGSV